MATSPQAGRGPGGTAAANGRPAAPASAGVIAAQSARPAPAAKAAASGAAGAPADKAAAKEGAGAKEEPAARPQSQDAEARRLADEQRLALRAANLAAAQRRPDAAFLKTLSSDIKRNTAFIRKLRTAALGTGPGDALAAEFVGLNLSKYVSEAVTALSEAPLRAADLPAAVRICSLLHQRYADFGPALVAALAKPLAAPAAARPPPAEPEAERAARCARKRITGRLLLELFEVGLCTEAAAPAAALLDALAGAQAELKERATSEAARALHHLALAVALLRAAAPLLGLAAPRGPGTGPAPAPGEAVALPAETQRQVLSAAEALFEAAGRALQAEHRAVRGKERENQRLLENRGELTEAAAAAYERLRRLYEKVQAGAAGLAELLGRPLPALPEEPQTTRLAATVEAGATRGAGAAGELPEGGLWEDEDTRAFYESLPDLRLLVPAVLLGAPPPPDAPKPPEVEAAEPSSAAAAPGTGAGGEDEAAKRSDGEPQPAPAAPEAPAAGKPAADEATEEGAAGKPAAEAGPGAEDEAAGPGAGGKAQAALEAVLARLPTCVNREAADALAVEFCYVNSKQARRRLVRALFAVPRTQLVLIPCYARLVATLAQCLKDVGPALVALLEGEFDQQLARKEQSAAALDGRLRTARYLAELCKFRVCAPAVVLHALKACLDDFAHHNVDVACALLDACGRFLYRSPESHVRTANLLELMQRRKASKALDARQELLVDNAVYVCKPPERSARAAAKERPPLEAYARHLVYGDLSKASARHVLRQLRKLPWADPSPAVVAACERAVLATLLNPHRGKYSAVHLVASVVAGLSAYHEPLGVKLVDLLLERIRAGLEDADVARMQRRLVDVKLLGELYNYCLFESAVVFDTLYLLLGLDPATAAPLPPTAEAVRADAPTDFFRVRLVCTLLDACGGYFDRGSSRRRLDRYLAHLQRYVLAKHGPPPADVAYMLADTLDALRPALVRYASLAEAAEAVRLLEAQLAPPPAAPTPAAAAAAAAGRKAAASANPATASGAPADSDSESDEEGGAEGAQRRSGTRDQGEEDEEEEEEEDEEDDGEEDGEGDDSDSSSEGEAPSGADEEEAAADAQVHVKRAPGAGGARLEDQDELDRELQRMLHESHEARRAEARVKGGPGVDIAIPMHLLRSAPPAAAAPAAAPGPAQQGEERQEMSFRVLLKKGNKQHTRSLQIPSSAPLALASRAASAQELAEQQEVRRFVLEYGEREESEAASRELAQLFPTQRGGRGGPVRRVLHLSGGTGPRLAGAAPPAQAQSQTPYAPGHGQGQGRGQGPARGRGGSGYPGRGRRGERPGA